VCLKQQEAVVTTADAMPHPEDANSAAASDPLRWRGLVVMLLAAFMDIVDTTVVLIAAPAIRADLGASYAAIQWVVAAYALALGLLLVTGGRLGDILGRKRLFLAGVALFTVASAACALAPGIGALIAARAVQGAAAGLMLPQILATVQVSFPHAERPKAYGAYGAMNGLGRRPRPSSAGCWWEATCSGWAGGRCFSRLPRHKEIHMRRLTVAFAGLCLGAALVSWAPTAAASTHLNLDAPSNVSSLTVPGDNFFPESIAATPAGTLFVSSVVTGEILRFRPGSTTAETFVPAGVNTGTAGVLVDMVRGVLWACAVDLNFQTPTALRAFDLRSGTLRATYEVPDRGVCADSTLAHGDVYITDTTDPIAGTPGRILRLTTPRPGQADGGALRVWSADTLFSRPVPFLQINGITFDGISTLYTTNLSTGELLRVPIRLDGSAAPATVIDLDRDLVLPDGIRMLDAARLLVTEMVGRLTLVNIRTGTTAVVSESLDQPSSLVRVDGSLWVSEGQVLRLLGGQPPNLPFKVRRLSITTLPPGSDVATGAVAS
jgi:MFS family permease